MRIGVFGGTFDPIHIAHLIMGEEARTRLSLEEVVFMPVGQPWLKAGRSISPPDFRLQMVRLAIASNPFFRASSLEIDRPGATYTVDTLEALHQEWGSGAEIYFIMGIDSLMDLPRWRQPERVLELCSLVVFARPGHAPSLPAEVLAQLPSLRERIHLLDGPLLGISGTEIRQRVSQGRSVRYLVPLNVERFITEHKLYTMGAR